MRTLGKVKLIAASAIMVWSMSSCLKSDEKFAVYPSSAYVLQEGNKYKLQIQIQGSEQLKSATASFDNKKYSFTAVEGSNNFLMQVSSLYSYSLDTVAGGICQITAYNAEGKSAVNQVQFMSTDKKIGVVNVTELSYKGNDSRITAKWNKVENAKTYYLVYRRVGGSYMSDNMWFPYGYPLTVSDEENQNLSATTSIAFPNGEKYEIGIGAVYGTTLRVGDRTLPITGGEDSSL